MPLPDNLARLVDDRARDHGSRTAFVWSEDGVEESARLGYEELARRSRSLAAHLAGSAGPGEPLMLCLPQGLDYVVALFACAYAGILSVPVYPPDPLRGERLNPRLGSILEDSRARAILTCEAHHAAVTQLAGDSRRVLKIEDGGEPATGDPAGLDAPPDTGAVLMYTSGSTGQPRGIVLSHRNMLYNLEHFPGFRTRPIRSVVSWLPFFHDLGLMLAILHPLYRGAESVNFPPLSFVQHPLRWLELTSRYRATTLGGPNFAYGLCAHRAATADSDALNLDLSTLNLVLNGAEPVRQRTVDRFSDVLAPYGFRPEAWYPSYGLAEAAATVSGGGEPAPRRVVTLSRRALGDREVRPPDGDAPQDDAVTLVGCGGTVPGQEIVIVDPDSQQRLPAGGVGEVWVCGPSIGTAVWRDAEETERRLRAEIVDEPGTPYLRTGDLGLLRQGELYLVGRLSDIIVLRGVNHHPEDLEPTIAAAHPACRPGSGVAVPVQVGDEERVGVIQEVTADAPAKTVMAAIRSSLRRSHDTDPGLVCLIAAGTLPKTSSGKVRRREARRAWQEGRLQVVAEWRPDEAASPEGASAQEGARGPVGRPSGGRRRPGEEILDWLVRHLARRLGMDPDEVEPSRPLAELGLPSLEAVSMIGELADWLDRPLPPTLAWQHPTLQALADFLDDGTPIPVPLMADRRWGEPVAVVGMSCRIPGAQDLDSFWQLLTEGRDTVTEVPADRWDARALYDSDPAIPGRCISRWGGFLPDLDHFDAEFFGLTPREAIHLDPRQRLTLELAYEALEHAGIPSGDLAGSSAGVFIANLSNDYDQLLYGDLRRVDAYSGTGTANSVIANRVSYTFDLRGPSLALDTACSGSLVAVHLAVQALGREECSLALAGGVSINLLPNGNVFFSRAGALSPTGRCRPFDAAADGIVRSDGAGMVVLKPLDTALADGDRILAVVRGTAVNQNGRSNGMMAPNGEAQEQVLRAAYRNAGVAPERVGYIEAHGTGTPLGDPIEAAALQTVLGSPGDAAAEPCRIGSLKSNVGHMEAAAGVGGLIKAILALRHGQVPPSIHLQQLNPLIDFEGGRLTLASELRPWPAGDDPRVAGISSFGFGGTNAHVVVEEWRRPSGPRTSSPEPPFLIPVSARSEAALDDLLDRWAKHLAADRADLGRLAAAAAHRRDHHPHRAAIVASETAEARAIFEQRQGGAELYRGVAPRAGDRVAFVFSGQGTHWPGMGHHLLRSEPAFRAAVEELQDAFGDLLAVSLKSLLSGDAPLEGAPVQAAIFAVQVGLVRLLGAWGIEPAAVLGQSLGEVAAAWAGGALPLADAARIVAHRSRLMQTTAGQGATAVLGLDRDETELALVGVDGEVEVAGVSGPRTTVISGAADGVDRLVHRLAARDVFARRLDNVDTAFHSALMDPLVPRLVDALEGVAPRAGRVPFFSAVAGDNLDGEHLDAEYWGRNLRQPFLLAPALTSLFAAGYRTVVEIGPHPVLSSALRAAAAEAERDIRCVPTLQRERPPREALLAAAGELYTAGCDLTWNELYPGPRPAAELPPYPWQRRRYWYDDLEVVGTAAVETRALRSASHPWLEESRRNASRPGETLHDGELSLARYPALGEHRVQGVPFVPGAVWVDLMLGAVADRLSAAVPPALRQIEFQRPLVLFRDRAVPVQVVVRQEAEGDLRVEVFSQVDEDADAGGRDTPPASWQLHASAWVGDSQESRPEEPLPGPARRSGEPVPVDEIYAAMSERGLQYGDSFRSLRRIWSHGDEVVGELEVPTTVAVDLADHPLYPAVLDAVFQTMAHAQGEAVEDGLFLPVAVDRIEMRHRLQERMSVEARLLGGADQNVQRADLTIRDPDGGVLARILGLTAQRLGAATRGGADPHRDVLFQLSWEADPKPFFASGDTAAGAWVVLVDDLGHGEAVAAELEAAGGSVHRLMRRGNGDSEPHGAVDPSSPEEVEQALVSITEAEDKPLRGIIHCWGVDSPEREALGASAMADELGDLFGSILGVTRGLAELRRQQVIQALTRTGWEKAPRLWMVTRDAQRDGHDGGPAALAPTALWGVSRVFSQEDPESWGGIVDLSGDLLPQEAAQSFIAEILDPDGEDHVLLGDQRKVQRLVEARPEPSPVPELRPDATYLVAGGFGGLGSWAARWLVRRGARRLLLIGRREVPPRRRWRELDADDPAQGRVEVIRDLEAAGAEVHWASCDLADRTALAAILEAHEAESRPPIRGVLHAAGAIDDHLLTNSELASALEIMAPKTLGTLHLDQLLGDRLDFFVLFSSIASTLGTLGEASYAAANAVQHAVAQRRRARGLPALTLDWGPWSEIGMAVRFGLAEQHRSQGMDSLAPEEAGSLLDRMWSNGDARWLAMAVDWETWCRSVTYLPPLVARFSGRRNQAADGQGDSSGAAERLLSLPDGERRPAVVSHLRETVAGVLRLDPLRVSLKESFGALGVDSIMMADIKRQIDHDLGMNVPIAELLAAESLRSLAEALCLRLEQRSEEEATAD